MIKLFVIVAGHIADLTCMMSPCIALLNIKLVLSSLKSLHPVTMHRSCNLEAASGFASQLVAVLFHFYELDCISDRATSRQIQAY